MEYLPDLTIERSAHSTVIACLAELGWAGLFLFVLIVVAVLLRLAGVRRAARGVPDFQDVRVLTRPARFHLGWHALALRAGLLGYLACALFTTRLFAEDFWLLIGLSLCLDNVGRHMRGEAEQRAEEAEPVEAAPRPGPAPALAPATSLGSATDAGR